MKALIRNFAYAVAAGLLLTTVAFAARPAPGGGNRIAWINPASPYAAYIEAAVQKKHLPVEFTIRKKSADVLITLAGGQRKGSAVRAIFTGNSGRASSLSMSVINLQTGIIVFSYTCHKGGHAFAFGHHQGLQSAAECLAKHWGDFLKKQGS
ncbi:MAG: hypothetical protein ACRD2E_05215 [Terriglobales bacterium]